MLTQLCDHVQHCCLYFTNINIGTTEEKGHPAVAEKSITFDVTATGTASLLQLRGDEIEPVGATSSRAPIS